MDSISATVSEGGSGVSALGPAAQAGTEIGAYTLLQMIGEGGFGEVWMAEQREPVSRLVALKIIKLGMDTRQIVARFEAERQALALMDHPNIAKVFDGGATDNGRPFFVMELVRGVPITDFCDKNQLGIRERLHLFLQVCSAIQHAHQKGIIHRDIKPSNVLVGTDAGSAVPKVIDFGIAKATQQTLTDKTLQTQLHQFLGTPAYMSPEQAEMTGIDIDTRTDIYSLGVLLYELLTGATPFETRELLACGIDQMRRIIREKLPLRPSTRLRQTAQQLSPSATTASVPRPIPGTDLDWIVMKCLEKDRTRRYETANGLAMDVNRHLLQEPVLARPPSSLYRLQKFAARNRLAVAAVGTILLTLTAGIVVSLSLAIRAQRAELGQIELRKRAEQAQRNEQQNRERAERATFEAQRNLYGADMLLAFQSLEKGHLGRTRELLTQYLPSTHATSDPSHSSVPNLQGWEWYHLWHRIKSQELYTLRGHSNLVLTALFLNGGRAIASGGADGTLRFWDTSSHSNYAAFPGLSWIRCMDVSPDGRTLLIGTMSQGWSAWDVTAPKLLGSGANASRIMGIAFSPAGDRCGVAEQDQVTFLEVPGFKISRTFERNPGKLAPDFIAGLAFSPDGRKLAFCRTSSEVVEADLSNNKEVLIGRTSVGGALSLAYSVDGKHLAASDRRAVYIFEVATRQVSHVLTNHQEQVVSVAFSPNGSLFASASADQTIRLYDATNFVLLNTLSGHEHEIHHVRFSADSRLLISASLDETVRVWDAQSRPAPLRHTLNSSASFLTRQGRLFLFDTNQTQFRLFDVRHATEHRYELPFQWDAEGSVFGINPDGQAIAFSQPSGEVSVWSLASNQVFAATPASTNKPIWLAVSASQSLLAVLRSTQELEFWDLTKHALVRKFDAVGVTQRTWSLNYSGPKFLDQDHLFVRTVGLSSQDEDADGFEIIRFPSWNRLFFSRPTKGTLNDFAADDKGQLLATAAFGLPVKLYELRTGQEIKSLGGQLVGFTSVALSQDGSRLAAGAWDGTITLWDLRSFRQVGHWKAHTRNCAWLHFIENDQFLVSGSPSFADWLGAESEVALWPAPRP